MTHLRIIRQTLLWAASLFITSAAQAQIVFADYSDPDICEGTDGDYWLTASSFQCTPGLPILHSTDMAEWTLVGYALDNIVPRERYDAVQHGCGVWAPCIRRHGDTYYIFWGDPDYGIYMVKTDDPAGRWDDPVLVVEGKGLIDPSPLWDEDGRVYLINGWAGSRCGFNSVLTLRELSADGTRAIGQPIIVYDGLQTGDHTIEGPKLYKKNGYYYILAPAGGVAQGWQLALRSRSIYGPYERKVVYDKDGIHQGGWAGDSFICFRETGAYGRVLHRLGVEMKDGWPMMKQGREDKAARLRYARPSLAYQWHANYTEASGFATADGCRVYGHYVRPDFVNLWSVPNLYLKKFEGETGADTLRATISATADGQQSGLVIMGRSYCRIAFILSGGRFTVARSLCQDADQGGKEVTEKIATVDARRFNAGAKDCYTCDVTFLIRYKKGVVCALSYSVNGEPYTEAVDGYLAREGKWIGAKYGVYSLAPEGGGRGWIDLKYKLSPDAHIVKRNK